MNVSLQDAKDDGDVSINRIYCNTIDETFEGSWYLKKTRTQVGL